MRSKITLYIFQGRVVSRFLFLLFFFSFFFIAHKNVAQENYLQKKISLSKGLIRLDSAMLLVKKQAGVIFSYNPRRLDTRQKIYIKPTTRTVSDFIGILKVETNVSVKIIENYVVIGSASKKEPALQAEKPIVTLTEKRLVEEDKKLAIVATVSPVPVITNDSAKAESKADSILVSVSLDTLINTSEPDSTKQIFPAKQPSSLSPADSVISNVTKAASPATGDTTKINQPSPKQKKKNNHQLFVKPGITVDESSFMGIVVQAGLPAIYVSFSVNTNLEASHFRYGIGSSFKLNPNLRLHFVITNGNVNRSGHFNDIYNDRYAIEVKSEFLRAGAGLEFRLPGKFSLQVIPLFNQLDSHYYISNEPGNLEIFGNDGDDLFYTIKPFYVISDTFSPGTTSNTKTWVGLQANLLFRINFVKGNKGNP